MRKDKDIRDDEIRVIGNDTVNSQSSSRRLWGGIVLGLSMLVFIVCLLFAIGNDKTEVEPETYFENQPELTATETRTPVRFGKEVDSQARGFAEIRDTTINDIPLRLFIPHNAEMSLHVGRPNMQDTTIVYAAQAADVRRDNGKIVGAFVLHGEPLAWGLSKKGFCASIEGKVTVGVADNSPLFEEATERGGYFFRQYPLVKDGVLIENEPKNKSERRAICDRQGEIFMVESLSKESFHDFAQSLVDLGVDQAVYLVGSNAYGWAVDENGERHEFGDENVYTGRRMLPKNTSYLIWRKYE